MIGHTLPPAFAFAGLLLIAAPAAAAQDDHAGHHGAGAGHRVLGEVHFPVTCSPEAQARFDQAMLLQHSFWYQQAAVAFRSVREADSGCTMAHWGEALTRLLNPFNAPNARDLEAGPALLADAPHALHMASHIFTQVGGWQASVDTNRRAAETARASRDPDDELHATDYMVYAYLQTARDGAAQAIVEGLDAYAGAAFIRNAGPFALAAIPARYALERGDWAAAAALARRESPYRYLVAMTHFARA